MCLVFLTGEELTVSISSDETSLGDDDLGKSSLDARTRMYSGTGHSRV